MIQNKRWTRYYPHLFIPVVREPDWKVVFELVHYLAPLGDEVIVFRSDDGLLHVVSLSDRAVVEGKPLAIYRPARRELFLDEEAMGYRFSPLVVRDPENDIVWFSARLEDLVSEFGEEYIEDELLFFNDLMLLPDIVEGEPDFVYIYDLAEDRLYYGEVFQYVFEREPDPEAEQEILEEFGYVSQY